jgi:hypothetical protein
MYTVSRPNPIAPSRRTQVGATGMRCHPGSVRLGCPKDLCANHYLVSILATLAEHAMIRCIKLRNPETRPP